jgi:acetoacetyl-CoA reductase
MKRRLEDRIALVTGGTGGIGTAICKLLADSGARVVATYRDQAKADRWMAERQAEGYQMALVEVEVARFDSCQAMAETVEREVGPIDVLVNNAGITRDTTFRKMTKDQWDCVLSSNLDSLFNVTRNVITGMLDRGRGRVINISSINGEKGQFGQVNYSAAKAGIHGFTMALAQEVARKGITVNTARRATSRPTWCSRYRRRSGRRSSPRSRSGEWARPRKWRSWSTSWRRTRRRCSPEPISRATAGST